MLVTIIYNTDYSNEATNLKTDILNEWSECKINKLGITNTINNAKYQILHDINLFFFYFDFLIYEGLFYSLTTSYFPPFV